MLTINPIKLYSLNKKIISFGENINYNKNMNNRVGLMSLDKNQTTKINFEKDLYEAKKADMVQSNPIKAIGYNFAKAYNTLTTPKRQINKTESKYIHIPYMA